MKNTLPLVIAVILGFAAVFMVSRMVQSQRAQAEVPTVEVVGAARELTQGEEIKEEYLAKRRVPQEAVSPRHVLWKEKNMILRQSVLRPVGRGDYVTLNDVGLSAGLGRRVAEGEWAVPITFSDTSLLQFLQPGDEVAILGTFAVKKEIASQNLSEAPQVVEERATQVVLPSVRILDVGVGDGMTGGLGGKTKTLIVSLPPQQAAMVVAAQQIAELYPALRRTSDPSARNRLDGGVVDDVTFGELRKGLKSVVIPEVTAK
jgi:Flp pilus assembly protein CpaB